MADMLLESAGAHARARLLVVEDDTNIREFCRLLLRQQYDVTTAANGQLAIEILAAQPIDLVLTDLQMPIMGGMALLNHINRVHPDIDVVILTAYASVETAREALKLGALDYLPKPVEAEQLERTVRTCLELRRVRQEKERLSDLVLMYQFSQTIATSLDIRTQIEQIVEFLWRRFAPESLAISMREPDARQLHLLSARTAKGWVDEDRQIDLPDACDEQTLVRAHHQLSGEFSEDQSRYVGIVLRSHDTPVGYLDLARRAEQPAFDAVERRLLGIFAGQVAASLDNARLYQALKDQNRETIEALAEAIEARDTYTYGHSRRVTHYAVQLAEALNLPADEIELITYAGLLHDVGKIGIRDHILLKPGALEANEFLIMQKHPRIGVKIIERVRGLRATLPIIESHHERWDGKGYPAGLQGEEIPLGARILAIADSFEAMTSNRPYRPAMATERALDTLIRGREIHWDTRLVDVFVALIRSNEGSKPERAARPEHHLEPQLVAANDMRD
ncbi:MAG: response regulator [Oscillochloris sp.]|nr:response regulator [Oscillochloris sp.]